MRRFRSAVSLVLALLLLMGLSTTAMAAQGYETVSLTGTQASAGSETFITEASIRVNMGDEFEGSLTIYKIADARYDTNSESVVVTWAAAASEGGTWIANLTENNGILSKYPSPAVLASATSAEQKTVLTSLAEYITDNQENAVKEEASGSGGSFAFTNLPIGIYMAYVTDDSGNHTPFTINVVPQKQDDGSWAIVTQEFRKKFSGASLLKTIDKDQVSVGDEVAFSITAGIPSYPTNMEAGKKIFTIDDDMATAFAYTPDSLEVVYLDANGEETALDQYLTDGTAIYTPVISSNVTVYSCPTKSHQYFNIYEVQEDGKYYYYFLKDDVMNLLYSTGSKASNTLSYTGPVFKAYQKLTGDKISHGLSPLNIQKNLFNVNFNYDALAQWMTANEKSGGSVQIRYKATVTEKAAVNADTNYNTAVLRYAKDESGTPERLEDTVRAYTYGINLVKVNGDTLTADGKTSAVTEYLAGAVFSLYRLDSATSYDVELDDLGRAASGNDMDAYNAALDAIMARNEVPYPLPNMVLDGTTTENTTDMKQNGYVLYGKIKNEITSVANATGVQVNGLGPGTYLLIEDLAPSGYNLLTQGLRFTIQPDETAGDKGKRDSLTGFTDGLDTYHTNGYLDLLVSNFKGLTLPETGGMGTAQFTGFGLLLMTAAMYILVMKKRRMA